MPTSVCPHGMARAFICNEEPLSRYRPHPKIIIYPSCFSHLIDSQHSANWHLLSARAKCSICRLSFPKRDPYFLCVLSAPCV